MSDQAIRAIAFATHEIRKSWPVADIERAMKDDPRPFAEVALAAITAARNTDTRFPGGIRTTYAGSEGCQKCSQRETNQQPPRAQRCTKCGQLLDDFHNCRPMKPTQTWHQCRRELATWYSRLISDAHAIEDWELAQRLQQEWKQKLAQSRDSFKVEVLREGN